MLTPTVLGSTREEVPSLSKPEISEESCLEVITVWENEATTQEQVKAKMMLELLSNVIRMKKREDAFG